VVEVEVDGDGIALGRNNVDSGGAGGKGLGGEVELESGARNFATAVIGADEVGWPEEEKGRSFLSSLETCTSNPPEVIGAGDEAVGRAGVGTVGRTMNEA